MVHELATTSLIEQLAEVGFQSSLIATYSCYFPFYEDVVLRRLMASGCTHNVLMVDATRCAEAYFSAELRPSRAGRDYTLIPVKTGGAFHPKVCLRFGKAKGSLFVGSHNLTLSGFGLNDEITNIFRAEGSGVRSGGSPMRQAFEYFSAFVPTGLPDVVDAYESLKLGVPWMDGPLGAGDTTRGLLTSSSTGPDLWARVAPLIPKDTATAFVSGPFFDPSLALVRRIQREVGPADLVIGIDPASVEIDPDSAAALSGVRWVNVAGMAKIPQRREGSSHYLHAKILWFGGKSDELLITGSANPSVAAFFASPSARNAEVVVIDRQRGAGDRIGVSALIEAPSITDADWAAVEARWAAMPERGAESNRRVLVATPTSTGFRTEQALPLGLTLRAIGEGGAILGEACVRTATTLEAPELVHDAAHYLEAAMPEEHLIVLVHRTEDIAANIGGDTRKALRQTLGALEEDPGQLEVLLRLTERVIFDSDDVVRATSLRSTTARELPPNPGAALSSLALDAAGRKSSRHKRHLAGGDIVILLDALVRRLGEGLPMNAAPRPRSDQDEIGKDEEDGGELSRKAPDFERLARVCQGKVRRLVKRMKGQFELANAPEKARRGIIQLAAVLGVVRALRVVGQRPEWRRAQLELIDRDAEQSLLDAAVLSCVWNSNGLAPRAVREADGEWFDELSMVTALLAWLAWDVGVDVDVASRRAGRQGVEEESWYAVQLLAALGPWLDGDETALATLEESVARTPRPGVDGDAWLHTHRALAATCALAAANPDHMGQLGRRPHPGDLLVLSDRECPRVRVVLDVRPGSGGDKVVFFDPAGRHGERAFLSSHIATLPLTLASVSTAASA